jgi:hypothetical protein
MRVAVMLALALAPLAAEAEGCYFVTNTRIHVLPSCDIGPRTIDALTEDPGPSDRSAAPQRRVSPMRRGSSPARAPRYPAAPFTDAELARKLELAEDRRLTAVARRVSAEWERDAALEARDEALRQLERLRRGRADARDETGLAASVPAAARDDGASPPGR